MNLQTFVEPLGDLLVWTFDTVLVPLGNWGFFGINLFFLLGGFVGLFIWLKMQAKYNAEAANNPDQIK